MDVPPPGHPLGHTEAQVQALLGDDYERFVEHMLMKTTARDEVGLIFFTHDVQWYLATLNCQKPTTSPRP